MPIPITFHDSPPPDDIKPLYSYSISTSLHETHQKQKKKNKPRIDGTKRFWISVDKSGDSTGEHNDAALIGEKTQDNAEETNQLPLPSTSTIPTTTTPHTIHSVRKSAPRFIPDSSRLVTLTPLYQPIINRCYPPNHLLATGTSTPLSPPPPITTTGAGTGSGIGMANGKKGKSTPGKPKPPNHTTNLGGAAIHLHTGAPVIPAVHIHHYSRLTDLGNNRSSNPSPKEILRSKKLEAEKARQRIENAAAARATAAKKRKNGKRSASKKRSPTPSKSTDDTGKNKDKDRDSGKEKEGGKETTGGEEKKEDSHVPTIMTEPASAESSPLPSSAILPSSTRIGLKRTRSQGLMPVSTGLANTTGTVIGVGSPLKASHGPEGEGDGEGDAGEDDQGRKKRSRLSDSSNIGSGSGTGSGIPEIPTRPKRQSSTSSAEGITLNLGLGVGLGVGSSRGGRASTHSPLATPSILPTDQMPEGAKTLPIPNAKLLPTTARLQGQAADMRRVVSASGAPAGTGGRLKDVGRTGSAGPEAGGRTRREVVLPGRLRDYDMRAGVA